MKKIIVILTTAMMGLAISSCASSREVLIEELGDLATEMEESSEAYSEDDWDKAIAKLAEIEEKMQEYEYSDEELKEIGRLKAQCLKSITRSSATILKGQLHNLQMMFEGAAEEFEGFGEELNSIFEGLFE